MRCPACGSLEDRVIDSRAAEDGSSIRRRRQCVDCSARFTTFERHEDVAPVVVKRDGRREPFDRTKIEAGIRAACKGRPVDDGAVAALVGAVEDAARAQLPQIEAATIGEMVLDGLRRLDSVAAVRFASVYKSFENPEDFGREILLLGGMGEDGSPNAPSAN